MKPPTTRCRARADGPEQRHAMPIARSGRARFLASAATAALAGALAAPACDDSSPGTPVVAGASTDTPNVSSAFDAGTFERLDELTREFHDVNRTPGVLVGIWSPRGTHVSATGVSDLATQAPLQPDMQFKIASQTKAFVGNLVLQLVSEGKVSLDDHISQWIEGVPNGDEITIR